MANCEEEKKETPGATTLPTQSSGKKNLYEQAQANNAELGFIRPKLRPTSPNTPHLTHIKQKNVVKKFAFATRVGFEPGNPDKVN